MRPPRVLVLSVQSPFTHGGAERHVRRLTEELVRRGVEADLVAMPIGEHERFDLVRAALAWRSLDLNEVGGRPVDAVIATRFPTWAIRHPNAAASSRYCSTSRCGSTTAARPLASSAIRYEA